MTLALDLRHLTLRYDGVTALDDVTAILRGQIIGVVGANASGKTSLLRILAGLAPPSEGMALIDGQPLPRGRSSWISYLPQETGFFPFAQRAGETLSLGLQFRGISDPEAGPRLLEAVGLEREDRTASGYSGGMKQRLRIAQALLHAPRLLLLDEPTTGLDVRERFRILRLLERLRERLAIVITTHQPEDAQAICDQVLLLHRGHVAACGSPAEVAATANGHVFTTTVRSSNLPEIEGCEVVRAEREGDGFRLRVVGTRPDGGEAVRPSLEDAYVLLTWLRERAG